MNVNNSNLEFRKIKSLNFLYEVNSNGTIFRNVKSKKQLKIKLDYHHSKVGYYTTFVHLNKYPKRVMIHKVVAECWLGDCPDGYEVDHRDRNPHNNDYRNLRYVIKSEQMKNRDHTNISRQGSINLQNARMERAKPVILTNFLTGQQIYYTSYAECARDLSIRSGRTFEAIRYKLKAHRSFILGYKITYL